MLGAQAGKKTENGGKARGGEDIDISYLRFTENRQGSTCEQAFHDVLENPTTMRYTTTPVAGANSFTFSVVVRACMKPDVGGGHS